MRAYIPSIHIATVPPAVRRLGCFIAKRDLVTQRADAAWPTVVGMVAHVAGDLARVPCANCRSGRGRWAGCVLPPGNEGHVTSWKCANCVAGGLECSLRSGGGDGVSDGSDDGSAEMDLESSDGSDATDGTSNGHGMADSEEELKVAFSELDLAIIMVGRLLAEPMMTVQEVEAELQGW